MDTLIHADVFFFITSVAVIVVSAILVIALIYLIRILRDAKAVTGKVKEETKNISEDIEQLRQKTKAQGVKVKNFFDFFSRFGKRYRTKRKR